MGILELWRFDNIMEQQQEDKMNQQQEDKVEPTENLVMEICDVIVDVFMDTENEYSTYENIPKFYVARKGLKEFLDKNIDNPKSEYLIPFTADQWIKAGEGVIKVIPTTAKWFGVTYKEDAPIVQRNLNELVDQKEYPDNLWRPHPDLPR